MTPKLPISYHCILHIELECIKSSLSVKVLEHHQCSSIVILHFPEILLEGKDIPSFDVFVLVHLLPQVDKWSATHTATEPLDPFTVEVRVFFPPLISQPSVCPRAKSNFNQKYVKSGNKTALLMTFEQAEM